MRKGSSVLFGVVCLVGMAAFIYFAHSAALQAVPAYSTLNTAPNGAKLLFDGMHESGIVKVERHFKSVLLEKPKQATVFFLGIEPSTLEFEEGRFFDEMENTAKLGNRLVIAVTDSEVMNADKKPTELLKRWGIHFAQEKDSLKSTLMVDKEWKPVAECGADVWERSFGSGSIVLVGSGDRLTNKGVGTEEANRKLLQQLVSSHPVAVFEEAHLGITETGSITGLARRYHLEGLMAGLILVAGLFVWNRSVAFPPSAAAPEKTMLGADSRSMLAEMMSRHLKGELVNICVAEWNRTRGHSAALVVPAEGSTVAGYTEVQESLRKRTEFRL